MTYQRYWTDRLHSSVVYGVVDVDNLDVEGPGALDRTQYFLVNLGCRVFQRMAVAIEYLWGERRNKDGEKARADRVRLGLHYGF